MTGTVESGYSDYGCNNGEDDDGDGGLDGADRSCADATDDTEANLCEDGVDNDGDSWVDLDDPSCRSSTGDSEGGFADTSECNDGVDNDGDGADRRNRATFGTGASRAADPSAWR